MDQYNTGRDPCDAQLHWAVKLHHRTWWTAIRHDKQRVNKSNRFVMQAVLSCPPNFLVLRHYRTVSPIEDVSGQIALRGELTYQS